MRTLFHSDAIELFFNGKADLNEYEKGVFNTSSLVVNSKIIDLYHSKNNENEHYANWISYLFQTGRVVNVDNLDVWCRVFKDFSENLDEYSKVSYFSDQRVVCLESLADKFHNSVEGVEFKTYLNSPLKALNPFKEKVLQTGGGVDYRIFDKYLEMEGEIIIYDRFVNENGFKLIEYLASKKMPEAIFKVFLHEEGSGCLSCVEINNYLDRFNNSKSYKVSHKTARTIHDRFINFGKRLHISLTTGIDQFGPVIRGSKITGFENRDSSLLFYDIVKSDQFYEIEYGQNSTYKVLKRY